MTTEMSNIKCGCGFSATGPDQEANKAALEEHKCYEVSGPTKWFHGLFSFEGAAVLFVVGWIIIETVKAVQ